MSSNFYAKIIRPLIYCITSFSCCIFLAGNTAHGQTIDLLAPVKTDAFPIGDIVEIKWVNPSQVSSVIIEYSVDNGITWSLVDTLEDSSNGTYEWTIPNLPENKMLIKVKDTHDTTHFDVSDAFFISKYKWYSRTQNANFSVRDGVGAYFFQNELYLIGGWNPLDPFMYPLVTNNEVWKSKDGISWELIANAPWVPRHTYGSVIFDEKMWVLGGDQLQCGFQTDIWNTSDGVNWQLVNDVAPWGDRMLHMYAVFDGKMWVMGGQKLAFCGETVELYNDVWNSTDGITWNLVTPAAQWSPRGQIAGFVVLNNKMWILGGGVYQSKYYNDVWSSSDGVTWDLVLEEAPWKKRQYHAVTVFDNRIWVMQGRNIDNKDTNDVWFSDDGVEWFQLQGTPWPARHAAAIFATERSIVIASGFLWNDVWSLEIEPNPEFDVQPISGEIFYGDTTELIVNFPTPNPVYQWEVKVGEEWKTITDSDYYSGTQTNTLSIYNVPAGAHLYRCIAHEGITYDTSSVATLEVLCPEITVQPQDADGRLDGSVQFVTSYPTPNPVYTWQVYSGSSWNNLFDNNNYSGTRTDTLSIINLTDRHQYRQYRCLIEDNSCFAISNTAVLRVMNAVNIYPNPVNHEVTLLAGEDFSNLTYKIIDLFGKPMKEGSIVNTHNTINVKDLNAGLYYIVIPELSRVLRFIKN